MSGDDSSADGGPSEASGTGFGPVDAGALRDVRDLVVKFEPLVADASLDDGFDPQTLAVELSDGVGDASRAHRRSVERRGQLLVPLHRQLWAGLPVRPSSEA